MNTNTKATAQAKANTTTESAFETVKRNYETALAQGKDTAQELTALATAVAYSVINKCIDPQRKTAAQRDTASNTGFNPAMLALMSRQQKLRCIPLIRKKSAKSSLNCRMTSVAKSSMFLMRATTMGFYPERLTTYTSLLLSVGFLLCMILLP